LSAVTSARGKGLTHKLVAAGVEHARKNGARRFEACPIDLSRDSRSIGLYVGSTLVRKGRLHGRGAAQARPAGR
jgi:hypothetical protein